MRLVPSKPYGEDIHDPYGVTDALMSVFGVGEFDDQWDLSEFIIQGVAMIPGSMVEKFFTMV
jgi:hypothetical protein